MKVTLFNTFNRDGGAARSAYRLFLGLKKYKLDCDFVSQFNKFNDYNIITNNTKLEKFFSYLNPYIDILPRLIYFKSDKSLPFSSAYISNKKLFKKQINNTNILHLHWVTHGFLSIEILKKLTMPIIWTLHDSWVFTGGCHLPDNCKKFENKCGKCPQLKSNFDFDLSRLNVLRKLKSWESVDLNIVCPSNWLANKAKKSYILKTKNIQVIPNGIDTNIFKPHDKTQARAFLNLPKNKNIILFGAMGALTDKNKGFDLLLKAIEKLPKKINKRTNLFVIFGANAKLNLENVKFKPFVFDTLSDDTTLSLLYSSADVMVVPSRQENFPNTVLESMSCGTPAVSFKVGGISDLIDHNHNGYMAKKFNINDLSYGIVQSLKKQKIFGNNARNKVVKEFAIELITKKYIQLYEKALKNNNDNF